ncbi:MAG: phenylalanyl-tRNA synthetase beta chain [Pseudonocardiales bacterium]|nr:phenylalanyl-tRNA synthetase beta chain [Pseudonocardiales bacterium]
MRVPLAWLREYVDIPADESARAVGDALVRAGLEVETVESFGRDVEGPVVVGQVLAIDEFEASNGKTIRYCQVDVGEPQPRGIVCGATNFAVGDKVVVSLPGATLAGGFAITARKTYGHVSDGMICSVRELGIGDEHTGILVLDADAPVGAAAMETLGLGDDVLDIAVTPDRGYCFSVRGIAREAATAYGVAFHDPADVGRPVEVSGLATSRQAQLEDPTGCDRYVMCTVEGFDPNARSPLSMRLRLNLAGMRPVALAVDITNYLMLELGQPLHAFDADKLTGDVVVRRAAAGERLETLDHVVRSLDPDDLLITDASGPIGLAGTMGGLSTEIDESSSNIVIEAAHFGPVAVARMSRRHKLASEASRRFERGVDPELPPRAAARAAQLLCEFGGGKVTGTSETDLGRPEVTITIAADHPDRVAGASYGRAVVVERLRQTGCAVTDDGGRLVVVPPSWRPDLTDPNDLAEEVIRLEGYDTVPSVLPRAPIGRGLTEGQRSRRLVGRTLAGAGYVEVLNYPFVAPLTWDVLGAEPDDVRRNALRLANPMSEEEPLLRTSLLPGLFGAARRNLSRGTSEIALYEVGSVYLPTPGGQVTPPRLGVDRRPTDDELAELLRVLPDQPLHLAVVLAGDRELAGWWGAGRAAEWSDAVEAVRLVATALRIEISVAHASLAPWHPGRCAAISLGGTVIGHAGELHPRVLTDLDLPARSCAAEVDLSALLDHAGGPIQAASLSLFPVATQDVALVVSADVPAADVEAALRAGAGELLESVRLFDVYTGDQIEAGRRSLAYALRFRAPDRTLTADEATAARESAVAEAGRRVGAVLRA